MIKTSLGDLPFNRVDAEGKKGEETQVPKASEYSAKVRPVVLADGSYATQTAAAETGSVVSARHITCNLRSALSFSLLIRKAGLDGRLAFC